MRLPAYGPRDLLFLAYLMTPVFFLTRFNKLLQIPFMGKYYQGFDFILIVWVGIFTLTILFSPKQRSKLSLLPAFVFLSMFGLWAILTAAAHDPSPVGAGQMLFAHTRWALPLLATYLGFRSLPMDLKSYRNAETSFIIAFGVVVALILLGTSVASESISAILGWQRTRAGSMGFTRAWTPIGSSITSGFLIASAYMLLLPRLLQGQTKRYFPIVTLDIVAVLFSLARSVVVALVIFHILIMRTTLRKYAGRIVLAGAGLLVINVIVFSLLAQHYSFERLISKAERSTQLRYTSAMGAIESGRESPVLGEGYGLLYVEARDRILTLSNDGHETFIVGNYVSALEPHNMYLLVLAETGFLGLLFFMLFWYFWHRRLKRVKGLVAQHPELTTLAAVHHAILLTLLAFGLSWSGMWIYPESSCGYWALLMLGPFFGACVEGEMKNQAGV